MSVLEVVALIVLVPVIVVAWSVFCAVLFTYGPLKPVGKWIVRETFRVPQNEGEKGED